MLHHKQIPPSLHYEKANPQIDFANSPFFVNTELSDWETHDTPLRAGVSSFGIGGTNAHVILEESPPREPSGESRTWQLLVLSAKTDSALENISRNLANHLQQHPHPHLILIHIIIYIIMLIIIIINIYIIIIIIIIINKSKNYFSIN